MPSVTQRPDVEDWVDSGVLVSLLDYLEHWQKTLWLPPLTFSVRTAPFMKGLGDQ